jgi:hypothetical protein
VSPLWSDLALARAVSSEAQSPADERPHQSDYPERVRPILKLVRRIPRRRVASLAL